MSIKFRYTISTMNGPEVMRRKFGPQVAQSLENLGKWWFSERLPLHFNPDAKRVYQYADRAKGYKKKRAIVEKLGGVDAPELLGISSTKKGKRRGTLMRNVKAQGLIRASQRKVTVQMNAPFYANMRSRQGQGPDKVAEIIAISPEELRMMPELLEDWLVLLVTREKEKTVKVVES